MDKLWGWQKSPAIVGVKSNWLAFFHSLTGCNKISILLGRRKRWISFPAVTGYFANLNSLPKSHLQITFAPLNDSSQYCMIEQASTYINMDMARKHLFTWDTDSYNWIQIRISLKTFF